MEILKKSGSAPSVKYDPKSGNVQVSKDGKLVKSIHPYELRTKCKCAACIDEMTGY